MQEFVQKKKKSYIFFSLLGFLPQSPPAAYDLLTCQFSNHVTDQPMSVSLSFSLCLFGVHRSHCKDTQLTLSKTKACQPVENGVLLMASKHQSYCKYRASITAGMMTLDRAVIGCQVGI